MSASSTSSAGKTIGFVGLEIYPATPGGAGILLYHTVCRLLEDGYTVVLLLDLMPEQFRRLTTTDSLSFPHPDRLHIFDVDTLAAESFALPSVFPDKEHRRAARIAAAVDILLQQMPLDILEFYDYCGPAYYVAGLARARNTKLIVRLHNTVELIDGRTRHAPAPERAYHYAMERAQLAAADLILTPGPAYFAEEIRPLYGRLLDGRRVLSSPPVTRAVMQATCDGQGQDIIFYGRQSRFKGLDTFLAASVLALQDEAFAQWAGRFLIIGPEEPVAGPFDSKAMADLVPDRHKDRFHILGGRSHADLAGDIANAAFACFANRMESYCYAAHELHLSGVPLILRASPAFRDHFKADENAVFFDGTAADLARAMIRLGADPRLRQHLSTSQGRNGPRYRRNFYADHLRDRTFFSLAMNQEESKSPKVSILIIAGTGTADEAVARTAKDLGTLAATIHCLRPCSGPACAAPHTAHAVFGGRRWDVFMADGRPVAPGDGLLQAAGDALLVVRAGDLVCLDWFEEAAATLAARPGVGAVGGWTVQDGRLGVQGSSLLTDLALMEPMGARVMIRLPAGLQVMEVLDRGRAAGDISLLLAGRADGRVRIDVPKPCADISRAIVTPYADIETALLVEGDRLSPRFLSLIQRLELPLSADRRPPSVHESDGDLLLQTRINPGLAILRARAGQGGGEVVLRRLFRDGGGFHEPWSAVRFSGSWKRTEQSGDPEGGAFRTAQQGQAAFLADERTAIECETGPLCGAIDIFFKGDSVTIDLKRSEAGAGLIGFDDLSAVVKETSEADLEPHAGERLGTAPFLRTLLARADGRARALALRPAPTARLAQLLTNAEGVLTIGAEEWGITSESHLTAAAGRSLQFLVEQNAVDRLIVPSGVSCGLVLAKALVKRDLPLTLSLVLDPSILDGNAPLDAASSLYAEEMDRLTQWLHVAPHLGDRLDVLASSSAYLTLFAGFGARTRCVPTPLPDPPESDLEAEEGVELLILGDGRLLPSLAHLITAWMLFEQSNTPVTRVWVPHHARELEVLWSAFGPRTTPQFYGSMADLSAHPRLSKALALCVFPEPEAPANLDAAIAAGFLPILGACNTLMDETDAPAGGQVLYWDNAWDIAREMERLCTNYQNEYDRLRSVIAGQRAILRGFMASWVRPAAIGKPPAGTPDTDGLDEVKIA